MFKEWRSRLGFFLLSKSHREIDEELQFLIEQQTQANLCAK